MSLNISDFGEHSKPNMNGHILCGCDWCVCVRVCAEMEALFSSF